MDKGHPTAPGPRGGPILGNLIKYRRDPARYLICLQRDFGEVAKMRLGPYTVFLVTEPASVRRVLQQNHRNYIRGRLYDQFKLVMGSGLLTSDGDYWHGHRHTVNPPFARRAVANIVPNVIEATNQMLDSWEHKARSGEPLDLLEEMLRLTLVTLSRSLFGYDIRSAVPALKQVVDSSVEIMFPHGYLSEMLPLWLPTSRNKLIKRNRQFLDRLVEAVRQNHAVTGEGPLLDLVEAARNPTSGEPWTDKEISDELLTIYLAGHETTAVGLCWALASVANHRWVREELESELEDVLSGRDPVLEDVEKLDYTRMVVEETLRMYPPIWLYPRDAVNADVLGGYEIPAGSSLLLSPLVSHRNPRVWDNPEAFDPQRFAPTEARRPAISYFPFGGGPRMCLGNVMALLESRLVVAMVAQRFRLELIPGSPAQFGDSLVSLRPAHPMFARVRSRTRTATTLGQS